MRVKQLNYFEHHIGDYDADTAHLTWVEDMAYTRLMRLYYRKEQPIPADINEACRLVRATARDQKAAVAAVLKEFFELRGDGWHQDRCDGEIVIYQKRVEHNRRVGKKGGRPRKAQPDADPQGSVGEPGNNPPGFPRVPGKNPPQTPDPSHSEPEGSGADGASDPKSLADAALAAAAAGARPKLTDPVEIIFGPGLAYLVGKGVPEEQGRSFLGRLRKIAKDDTKVVDALRACIAEKAGVPVEYLTKAVMPPKANGKHAGFDKLDYREGIGADGSFN